MEVVQHPEPGKVYRRKKGYLGRSLYRKMTAKRGSHDYNQKELLDVILGDSRASKALLNYAGGDLRTLDELDVRFLAAFPHMGEARAARLAAVFQLYALLAEPVQERPAA